VFGNFVITPYLLYYGIYNLTNKLGHNIILLNFILRITANVDTNSLC
jgi:hypothetical protein